MAEDKKNDLPGPQPDEITLRQGPPYFWFGLMAIPVVIGFLAAIFAPPPQATPGNPPQAQVEEAPQTTTTTSARQHKTSARRSRERATSGGALACDFSDYVGKTYSKALDNELGLTQRPVVYYKEIGQQSRQSDPARINVYLNKEKKITRIECG